jgi:(4-(4-[2-(gamma-L-glutamylamino)ethyl]phenoxymethyl)furan-2-yl)methanamine synthase
MPAPEPTRRAVQRWVGWDIGGAHVKACVVERGEGDRAARVRDIAQWPCPLWQGLEHLNAAIALARARWPEAWDESAADTCHVVTMTGEMVDLFAHREDGVRRLAGHLAEALGPSLRLYAGLHAGTGAGRWVPPDAVAQHWPAIASANWRATAEAVAARWPEAVLVDIGSTTTDLTVLRGGRITAPGASDAMRLASGALVYQGVVRTPLCALAQRVPFDAGHDGELGHEQVNVMNEFFATTADVYRLTGELDPAHDQQATADHAAKDLPATRQRLARMIGRDAHEAGADAWLALANFWRSAQRDEIAGQLARVLGSAPIAADAPLIGAGCGDFLAAELAARSGRPYVRFADLAVPAGPASAPPGLAAWAQVCAPAVAVALLAAQG